MRDSIPSLYDRPDARHQMGVLMALSCGGGASMADMRKFSEIDLLDVLPAIRIKTLVLHRTLDPVEPVQSGRLLAERIPDATLVELPGVDGLPWAGEASSMLDEIERFLTGDMPQIDTTGDGFFATFDGPARAVECAKAITASVRELGLEVRVGVHTGEVEQTDGKPTGIAVVIGARAMSVALPSEVLVTSTVKDLVAGSGQTFEDAGEHELKGVPDRWHLYRVAS